MSGRRKKINKENEENKKPIIVGKYEEITRKNSNSKKIFENYEN